jgi:hypothetical protein
MILCTDLEGPASPKVRRVPIFRIDIDAASAQETGVPVFRLWSAPAVAVVFLGRHEWIDWKSSLPTLPEHRGRGVIVGWPPLLIAPGVLPVLWLIRTRPPLMGQRKKRTSEQAVAPPQL